MSFWFLVGCAFIIVATFVFFRKWHDSAALFTVGIGFSVNANIFNGTTVPVVLGDFVFSIDSILYTVFMFAVLISAHEYGFKSAKTLMFSAVGAILVSAVIELLANISSWGYQTQFLNTFLGYIFSAIGTFLGIWAMLAVYKVLEKKNVNEYLNFLICILIASIINTTIYYAGTILATGERMENLWGLLLGSYIGKLFCILLCQIAFWINTHIWIPNSLKEKYCKQKVDNKLQN